MEGEEEAVALLTQVRIGAGSMLWAASGLLLRMMRPCLAARCRCHELLIVKKDECIGVITKRHSNLSGGIIALGPPHFTTRLVHHNTVFYNSCLYLALVNDTKPLSNDIKQAKALIPITAPSLPPSDSARDVPPVTRWVKCPAFAHIRKAERQADRARLR